jgi:hypothetical protein
MFVKLLFSEPKRRARSIYLAVQVGNNGDVVPFQGFEKKSSLLPLLAIHGEACQFVLCIYGARYAREHAST